MSGEESNAAFIEPGLLVGQANANSSQPLVHSMLRTLAALTAGVGY